MTEIDIELMADEAIDVDIADVIETGGSGGIINYNLATNKPRVNGIELKGDKSIKDLGIDVAINEEVADYVTEHKAELKGEPGKDGFAPVASVSQTMGGAVITITDKNGTTTANITNGIDGKTPVKGVDYTDGKDGEDGISPAASIERITNGAVITIVDKNGTTSATINDGQNGEDGDDGFSPVATVSKITDGVVISIQDKNGITTETVKNGKDGEPGKDYVITSADYDAIATVVVGKLPKYDGGVV